jgi:hypothetical protein
MSSLNDAVGGAHLYSYTYEYQFVSDRFGNPSSAIYLNNDYLSIPSGVYFNGDLTITAWFKLKSYRKSSRIVEFSNGPSSDNIVLAMHEYSPQLYIMERWNAYIAPKTSEIKLGRWYHIAYVLECTNARVYVNGVQILSATLNAPANVYRSQNYIGRSS